MWNKSNYGIITNNEAEKELIWTLSGTEVVILAYRGGNVITGIILSSAVDKYLHSYNNMTVYCFSAFRQIKKDLIMIIT